MTAAAAGRLIQAGGRGAGREGQPMGAGGDFDLSKLGWWSVPVATLAGLAIGLAGALRHGGRARLGVAVSLAIAGAGAGLVLAVQSQLRHTLLRGAVIVLGLLAVVVSGLAAAVLSFNP